jgi:hypothetical protein
MTQASGWQLSGTASQAYERYIVQAFMQSWTLGLLDVAQKGRECSTSPVGLGWWPIRRLAGWANRAT